MGTSLIQNGTQAVYNQEQVGYKFGNKLDTNLGASRIKFWEQIGYKSGNKLDTNLGIFRIQKIPAELKTI